MKLVFKKFIILIFFAQHTFAEKFRVGYVDLEYLYENSALKKAIYKEYSNQKEKIRQVKKNSEKKIGELNFKKKTLSVLLGYEEFLEEVKEIDKEIEKEEKLILEAKEAMRKWETENAALLFDEVMLVLELIAEEEDLDLILSKKNAIIYGDPALDVTQRAIDLINETDERSLPGVK